MTDLFDGVKDEADLLFLPSNWPTEVIVPRQCHGCFQDKQDVDLCAEDTETGEQLWLCEACAHW